MLLFWSNNGFNYKNPSIWACIQPLFSPVFVNHSFPFSIQTSITNITQKLQFQPNSALRSVKAQLGVQKKNGGPEGFAHVNSNSIHLFKSQLPFLKLTWPLKIDGLEDEISFLGWRVKKKNRLPKNRRGFKFLFRFFFLGGMYMTQIAIDSHFRRIFIGTLFKVMFRYIAANGFPCAVVGSEIQRANHWSLVCTRLPTDGNGKIEILTTNATRKYSYWNSRPRYTLISSICFFNSVCIHCLF